MNEQDNDTQFRCTICGQVGTVGRCCGLTTREPMNDLARAELCAEVDPDEEEHGMPIWDWEMIDFEEED